ncbi:hypothetical protein Adt_03222 [Abeliophyllum distichum]|uniref:Uncharacterized protein n=1 Tax=Abeliophyllum distichum TaxID=126358 RepID=A0ABD1VXX0_9LAMI
MRESCRGSLHNDILTLAEMNLIYGLVLTKELYSTLEGFDRKFAKEEANLKKLSKNLKAMSLGKAQLESDKRFLQVELKAARECLKDARDQIRATEASQKCTVEAQKLAKERAFTAETAMATANTTLEAMLPEKDKLLAEVKEEIERVKVDRADAEARMVAAYQDRFEDMSEYKDLAHHFITAGREDLGNPPGVGYFIPKAFPW